jgi:thioredoxin reductase (NADPH)
VLLTVDDDPQVLITIEHDLWQQYGKRFRIVGTDSGHKGLELTEKLKIDNKIIALYIVDQRMPQMTGVEFLQRTMNVFPEAKTCFTYRLCG